MKFLDYHTDMIPMKLSPEASDKVSNLKVVKVTNDDEVLNLIFKRIDEIGVLDLGCAKFQQALRIKLYDGTLLAPELSKEQHENVIRRISDELRSQNPLLMKRNPLQMNLSPGMTPRISLDATRLAIVKRTGNFCKTIRSPSEDSQIREEANTLHIESRSGINNFFNYYLPPQAGNPLGLKIDDRSIEGNDTKSEQYHKPYPGEIQIIDESGQKFGGFKSNKEGIEYLSELSKILGFYNLKTKRKIITLEPSPMNGAAIQLGWLKQLDEKALKELSGKLAIKFEDLKKNATI